MNFFSHFKKGLEKTSNFLSASILDSISAKNIDQETLEELNQEYLLSCLASRLLFLDTTTSK